MSDLVEIAMTQLETNHPYLTREDFIFAETTITPDCFFHLTLGIFTYLADLTTKGLSIVELTLLVSMAVLEYRQVEDYNFSLIYSEYYSKALEVNISPQSEVKLHLTVMAKLY